MHGASACSPPPDKRALGCSRKRPASCTLRPAAPCSQASCLCEAEAVGLAVSLHEAHEAVPLALGLHHHHTLDDARLAVDEVRRHLRGRECALVVLEVHACGLSELRAGCGEEGGVVEGEGGDAGRAVARPRQLDVGDARLRHTDDELDVRSWHLTELLCQRNRLPSQSSGACLAHTAQGEGAHLLRSEEQRQEKRLGHVYEDPTSKLLLH
mmetsp:Transcript_10171/g.23918  ORF Transcript_10171/g.23918 Transcript_10171/m.23918 type:complete len:211 (-) Transcript_10171:12-644(-)